MKEIVIFQENGIGFSTKAEEGAKYKTEGFGIHLVDSHLCTKWQDQNDVRDLACGSYP